MVISHSLCPLLHLKVSYRTIIITTATSIQKCSYNLSDKTMCYSYKDRLILVNTRVLRLESLRMLLALSVRYGFKLHQVDITTAFLNGHVDEGVYMAQPDGFVSTGN